MKERLCGIYKITCVVNNVCYIGQSIDIKSRWTKHLSLLRHNHHENNYLQNLFNKYGETNIKFEIVECCSITELDEKERYWIAYYGGVESKKNCNWESGGHERKVVSTEIRKKNSLSHKGRRMSIATEFKKGSPPWNKGKKATEETRKRLSDSHKGYKVKEETKNKLKVSMLGKGIVKKTSIPVAKVNDNGDIVKIFPSLGQAAIECGINFINVKKRAKHPNRKYQGYYWRFMKGN